MRWRENIFFSIPPFFSFSKHEFFKVAVHPYWEPECNSNEYFISLCVPSMARLWSQYNKKLNQKYDLYFPKTLSISVCLIVFLKFKVCPKKMTSESGQYNYKKNRTFARTPLSGTNFHDLKIGKRGIDIQSRQKLYNH